MEPDMTESEEQAPPVMAPLLREPPAIRRTSSMGNPGRDGGAPSGLELKRFVPRTMSDTGGVNPLEAWRDERSRARRYRERATRPATAATGERASQSNESKRIRPTVCSGESDAEEAKSSRMDDEEMECRSNPTSINGFPMRERPKARKAWKSGSMLVRPRADNGSERVSRTMYIYLVGSQKMDVELLVGPPGSQLSKVGEKHTVVRTMMSAGKHVCIPEHKTYLIRNMSDKRTAVLFWASPNESSAAAEEKKKERYDQDDVRATLARFFPVPA